MTTPRIIYIKTLNITFVEVDEAILKAHFPVITYFFTMKGKWYIFLAESIKLIFSLITMYRKFDYIAVYFVDYYSFFVTLFKKLFKKKLIIYVGGYDAMGFTEFGYGVFASKIKGFVAKFTFSNADLCIAVHEDVVYGENTFIDDKVRYLGVKYFVPDVRAAFKVVHFGFDKDYANEDNCNQKEENMVLLIGITNDKTNIYRKGIDTCIQVSRMLPQYNFFIVGVAKKIINYLKDHYHTDQISNLKIYEKVPQSEVKALMERAKIIAMPSIIEAFGLAICEGMLHKCIPVGSNINAIPLIIGETGVVFNKRDPALFADAITKAMTMDTGEAARQRILEKFSLEKREKAVVEAIKLLK